MLADVPITFSEWKIANPSIGGFVTAADSGTLEVLLHFTQGPGNPASKSSGTAGFGGGGPVTLPSTTVPPLECPLQLTGSSGPRPGRGDSLGDAQV